MPYDHGEVVSRVHEHGEVRRPSHTAEVGTRLEATVPGWLAGELAGYAAEPVLGG